jgi:hypothetical protein
VPRAVSHVVPSCRFVYAYVVMCVCVCYRCARSSCALRSTRPPWAPRTPTTWAASWRRGTSSTRRVRLPRP